MPSTDADRGTCVTRWLPTLIFSPLAITLGSLRDPHPKPERAERKNHDRADSHHNRAAPLPAQVDNCGQQRGGNTELARLDAEVEGEQRGGQQLAREVQFLQRGGEPETVDQAEEERDHPAAVELLEEQILERDVHDGQRNAGLHDPAWKTHDRSEEHMSE